MDQKFRCPVYKKCGGCQLDVTYPQQLSYKQRTITSLLGKFHKIEPIIGMDDHFHYRCKVSTAFGYSHGRVISGVWQSSAGKLTPVDDCALEDERAGTIIAAIKELLPSFKLRTYDERSGRGFLRFVMIRIGKQSGEILVALGTGSDILPMAKNFTVALAKKCPDITTIVRCVSTDKLNLLLGREETVLYGPGYITDRLCGYDFRISARSFFQINPVQTEKLYATAVEFAQLDGKQTVIDAYCGVGTIGIIASKGAKTVIAAEVNGDAVKNARENVRLNGIKNVEVIKADAGEFMADLAEDGKKIDVVFTDPPRAGCSRQFLSSLVKLAPAKVIYVSCNPETQARDLQYLTANGYKVDRIRPVDMFPFTRHIECVVRLRRS
ncbi:MAG: 23S rRNA (uracil(1939)-C(5))-methyltransferase RlmD [Oscillospiraceae bacterium]|nr:23S rRNA (uracil(1939)-C(5))-methyltransferase RlmD [Oscillospiraceae bacterium]